MILTYSNITTWFKRYWEAFEEVQRHINNERRFNKFTKKMFTGISRPEVITDEITYSTGGPVIPSVRMLSYTSLPIIDPGKLIRVTQIPCKQVPLIK